MSDETKFVTNDKAAAPLGPRGTQVREAPRGGKRNEVDTR
jgi:hypothetical protein